MFIENFKFVSEDLVDWFFFFFVDFFTIIKKSKLLINASNERLPKMSTAFNFLEETTLYVEDSKNLPKIVLIE